MRNTIELNAVQFAGEEIIKKRLLIKPSEILLSNPFLEFKEHFEEVVVEQHFISLQCKEDMSAKVKGSIVDSSVIRCGYFLRRFRLLLKKISNTQEKCFNKHKSSIKNRNKTSFNRWSRSKEGNFKINAKQRSIWIVWGLEKKRPKQQLTGNKSKRKESQEKTSNVRYAS